MNYDFDHYRVKTDGATAIIDARNFGGAEDAKLTFAPDFSVDIVYLNQPPANFKWAVDGLLASIASAARQNALAEGLDYNKAWDDYFSEQAHQRLRQAARQMRKGIEFRR